MKKSVVLIVSSIFFLWVSSSQSNEQKNNPKEEFVSQAQKMVGHYKLVKDSDERCSDGYLKFVNDKIDQGLHLSHHVFVGPFGEEAKKQEEGYCQVNHEFSFSAQGVRQITKVSRCPAAHKQDESITTKALYFKGEDVFFEIKESGLKCHFVKAKGVADE